MRILCATLLTYRHHNSTTQEHFPFRRRGRKARINWSQARRRNASVYYAAAASATASRHQLQCFANLLDVRTVDAQRVSIRFRVSIRVFLMWNCVWCCSILRFIVLSGATEWIMACPWFKHWRIAFFNVPSSRRLRMAFMLWWYLLSRKVDTSFHYSFRWCSRVDWFTILDWMSAKPNDWEFIILEYSMIIQEESMNFHTYNFRWRHIHKSNQPWLGDINNIIAPSQPQ